MANTKGNRRRFGSVRQLPSGRWQVRYRDPLTGQLRSAEDTYATKRDAEVALTLIEASIVTDKWTDPDAGSVNFADFAATWIKDRKLEESTRERYATVLRLHILPKLGGRSVGEISPPRVRAWRSGLLDAGVGEPSVVKAYQMLRAILNTAVDDGLIQRNPCRIKGADTYDVPERPVLTVPEVFAVADAIGPRWRALVLVTAFATLRFGELAALRRQGRRPGRAHRPRPSESGRAEQRQAARQGAEECRGLPPGGLPCRDRPGLRAPPGALR
ncbi:tyrosine-type recombinase/integrase [Kitasatospora arboriphila]